MNLQKSTNLPHSRGKLASTAGQVGGSLGQDGGLSNFNKTVTQYIYRLYIEFVPLLYTIYTMSCNKTETDMNTKSIL